MKCTNIDLLTWGGHWRRLVDAGWWHCIGWSWSLTPVHCWTLWPNPSCTYWHAMANLLPNIQHLAVRGHYFAIIKPHGGRDMQRPVCYVTKPKFSGLPAKKSGTKKVYLSDPTGKTLLFLMNSRLFFFTVLLKNQSVYNECD